MFHSDAKLHALRPIFRFSGSRQADTGDEDVYIPQFKMLAPFQRQLCLGLALRAFQPQHHFLRRLGFFVEDGFCLAAVARLLAVVAAFSLGKEGGLLFAKNGMS